MNDIKKLPVLHILIGVILVFSALIFTVFNGNTANAITKEQCESAGGAYTGNYVGGGQVVEYDCDFNFTADEQISSYSYYTGISQCIRQGWMQITAYKPTEPTTWSNDNEISVGYIADPDDGTYRCNTLMKKGLDLWGYKGTYEVGLQEILGYSKVNTPSNCTGTGSYRSCTGTTESYVRPAETATQLKKFQAAIKNLLRATPSLEGRADLLYRRAIAHIESPNACSASPYKKVSELSGDDKVKYKDNKTPSDNTLKKGYLIVPIVNGESWKVEEWVYKLPADNWAKMIKPNEKPSGGPVETTCVGLAIDMADRAKAIATDAAEMIAAGKDPKDKYGDIIKTPGQNAPSGSLDSPAGEGESACKIEGIGWVLCPVINAMAGMTDATFNLVKGFMQMPPIGLSTDEPLYKAWSVIRNIANVAFVIAFLIIIFSQLTGAGVTNYGVKKMLPRLIVAAILVNLSYLICVLAVDLSNIVGVSLQELLTTIANQAVGANNSALESWGSIAASVLAMNVVAGASAIGIASLTAAGIWGAVAGLLPLLVSALFAILVAFLVLLARQALIIILIVISPLAFVAYLLPNTEGLFKKWRTLFTTLLVLFPLMAIVFGGSILASAIMRIGAESLMQAGSAVGFFMYLGSVAILALPFFITPILINLSSGVLNRFAGFVNNKNRGPFDRMRKGAERVRDNAGNNAYARKLRNGTGFMDFGAKRRVRKSLKDKSIESGVAAAEADATVTDQKSANYVQQTAYNQLATSAVGVARSGKINEDIVAGGSANVLNALGSASANPAVAAAVASQAAKALAEELKDELSGLSKEFAQVKSGSHPTFKDANGVGKTNTDEFLQGIATDNTQSATRREAAMNMAASMGRSQVIRNIQANPGADSEMVQRSIGANPGGLAAKAPDLLKGAASAFENTTGDQIVNFSTDTGRAQIAHIDDLHNKRTAAASAANIQGASQATIDKAKAAQTAYENAVQGFNSGIEDIHNDTSLQTKLSPDLGREYRSAASTLPQVVQADLTGISRIETSGKIR